MTDRPSSAAGRVGGRLLPPFPWAGVGVTVSLGLPAPQAGCRGPPPSSLSTPGLAGQRQRLFPSEPGRPLLGGGGPEAAVGLPPPGQGRRWAVTSRLRDVHSGVPPAAREWAPEREARGPPRSEGHGRRLPRAPAAPGEGGGPHGGRSAPVCLVSEPVRVSVSGRRSGSARGWGARDVGAVGWQRPLLCSLASRLSGEVSRCRPHLGFPGAWLTPALRPLGALRALVPGEWAVGRGPQTKGPAGHGTSSHL